MYFFLIRNCYHAQKKTDNFYYFFFVKNRFIFRNNGVLFENDLLQIGVKSEYRQNLGRIALFYGNKTQTPLQVKHIFRSIFDQKLISCLLARISHHHFNGHLKIY